MDTAPALLLFNAEGRVVWNNPIALRLFGYSDSEITGLDFHALFAPWNPSSPDEKSDFAAMDKTGSTPEPMAGIRKNGKFTAVHVLLTPLPLDDSQHSLCVASNLEPVLKGLTGELSEETLFRRMFEHHPLPMMTLTCKGDVGYVNPALEKLFSQWITPESLMGKNLFQSTLWEKLPFSARFQDAVLDNEALEEQLNIEAQPENTRGITVRLTPLPNRFRGPGDMLAVFGEHPIAAGASPDDSKTDDAASPSMRMRTDFLANMSHELRTPLNGIIGFIKLAEDGEYDSDEERNEYLTTARQSAMMLLELISNMLNLAKVESDTLPVDEDVFEPLALLDEICRGLSPQARAKRLEIAGFVSPHTPRMIISSKINLRQVLVNLVGNALKFTKSGSVVISAAPVENPREASQASSDASDRVIIKFMITDTGEGISSHHQESIFESFVQQNASAKNSAGDTTGIGLGLPISRQIVERMGGEIGVESAEGKGSTFWITVPVGLPAANASTQAGAEKPSLSQRPGHTDSSRGASDSALMGVPLLFVDPNPFTREAYLQKLRYLGADVVVAENMEEAKSILEKGWQEGTPCKLVLMDHQLGLDAATRFGAWLWESTRVQRPDLIYLSKLGAVAGLEVLRHSGFTGFLTKPAGATTLASALSGLVTRQGPQGAKMPLKQQSGPMLAEEESTGEDTTRILVAEDNPVNQKLISTVLSKLGYPATLVSNGKEAVEIISRESFGLAFMDVQMPVMDGLTATREIRAMPEHGQLPIIALTADATEDIRTRCLEAGMNDFMIKPIMPDRVQQTLQDWLFSKTPSAHATISFQNGHSAMELDLKHLEVVKAFSLKTNPVEFTGLLARFVKLVRQALPQLQTACDNRKPQALRAGTQQLRWSCEGFGAPALATACQELETKCELVLDHPDSQPDDDGTTSGNPLSDSMENVAREAKKALEALESRYGTNITGPTPGEST